MKRTIFGCVPIGAKMAMNLMTQSIRIGGDNMSKQSTIDALEMAKAALQEAVVKIKIDWRHDIRFASPEQEIELWKQHREESPVMKQIDEAIAGCLRTIKDIRGW